MSGRSSSQSATKTVPKDRSKGIPLSAVHAPVPGSPDDQASATTPDLAWAATLKISLYVLYAAIAVVTYVRAAYHQVLYALQSVAKYHHRSPELIRDDVSHLKKIPRRVGVILNLKEAHTAGGGVNGLLSEVGEVAMWSVGVGIPELTVYEASGVLKKLPLKDTYTAIGEKLDQYFGKDKRPSFCVTKPQCQQNEGDVKTPVIRVNLISAKDGRTLLVELTRTFADLAAQRKLHVGSITLDVIDKEVKKLAGPEPDLLVMFTPRIDLQGYPPWQIRVTEMFYLPDNNSVSYLVFLKALKKFSNVKINLGK